MQLQNIVVGVSDSQTSRTAGARAFEIAETSGATVHVVTAVQHPTATVVEVGSDTFRIDDLDSARDTVENWIGSVSPRTKWKIWPVDDKPSDALVDIAKQVDADLIVVGNVRMQGPGRLLGSVASHVAHHAPCDVLIVKTV